MRGSSRPPPPPGKAAGRRAGRCCCGRWASGGCRSARLPGSLLPAGETLRTADGEGEGAGRSPRAAPKRGRGAEEAAAAPPQGQHRAAGSGQARRPRSHGEARSDGQPAGAAPDGVQLITAGGLGDPRPGGGCGGGLGRTCRQPAHPPAADTRGTAPSTRGRRRASRARAHGSPPPFVHRSRCACSLVPFPRPAALRRATGPKVLLLPLPPRARSSLGRRRRESARSGAEGSAATSLAPPPGFAADWVLPGTRLRAVPAPCAGRAPWERRRGGRRRAARGRC